MHTFPPLLMTGLQTHLSVYLQGYSTYIYKVLQVQPSTMQQMELGHINSSTHNYSFIVSLKNQLQGVPTITDWNVREHKNKHPQRAQGRAQLYEILEIVFEGSTWESIIDHLLNCLVIEGLICG